MSDCRPGITVCAEAVGYAARMSRKRPPTSKGAKKLGERERTIGLELDDEAARWLDEHDPPPKPQPPKAASKSKALHRWRQRQQQRG
jgi:hypothetical protein